MFLSVFISWWFLLLVISFVIRGIVTGYLSVSAEEDSFMYQLSRIPTLVTIVLTITAFKYILWWMALLIFPIVWVVALIVRLILADGLLPLATNRGLTLMCGLLSSALAIASLVLFII